MHGQAGDQQATAKTQNGSDRAHEHSILAGGLGGEARANIGCGRNSDNDRFWLSHSSPAILTAGPHSWRTRLVEMAKNGWYTGCFFTGPQTTNFSQGGENALQNDDQLPRFRAPPRDRPALRR